MTMDPAAETESYRFGIGAFYSEDMDPELAATHRTITQANKRTYEENLWDRITSESPNADTQEVEDVVRILSEIKAVEQVREEVGFDQVERFRIVIAREGWRLAGYNNFRELVTSPDRPCSKSAGYRFKAVVEFTETFPIGDAEFDKGLHERWNIPLKEVRDADGVVDAAATDEANRFVAKGRFNQVARIASLFNKGTLDHAHADELLGKSLLLDEDGFDELIKDVTGNTKDSVADALRDRGIWGMCALVPLNEREKAIVRLRDLADRLQAGEDFTGPVVEKETNELGKKSVTFHVLPDEGETVLGIV